MNNTIKAALAATAALAIAVPVYAAHLKDGRKLAAMLDGASEVPGPGDPDGFGTFVSRTNTGQGEICYTLTVADIGEATAAHIHRGGEGVAGPVEVVLSTPSGGQSAACAMIDRQLAKELIRKPDQFYINVHNAEFPGGAVRGQLMK